MAIFNYLTKDPQGKRKEGEIRADSLDSAVQKLSANGQLVFWSHQKQTNLSFYSTLVSRIEGQDILMVFNFFPPRTSLLGTGRFLSRNQTSSYRKPSKYVKIVVKNSQNT